MGKHYSLLLLPTSPSSLSRTLEELFELTHRSLRAINLPRALLLVQQKQGFRQICVWGISLKFKCFYWGKLFESMPVSFVGLNFLLLCINLFNFAALLLLTSQEGEERSQRLRLLVTNRVFLCNRQSEVPQTPPIYAILPPNLANLVVTFIDFKVPTKIS